MLASVFFLALPTMVNVDEQFKNTSQFLTYLVIKKDFGQFGGVPGIGTYLYSCIKHTLNEQQSRLSSFLHKDQNLGTGAHPGPEFV